MKRDHKASEQDWRSNEASRHAPRQVTQRRVVKAWPIVSGGLIVLGLIVGAHYAWTKQLWGMFGG